MRIHNATYLIREGARNLFANKLMSFACIGVLVACLLLIGGAAMFSLNVNSIVDYVEDQNEMVVFLDESLTPAQVQEMGDILRSTDNIQEVVFKSRDEYMDDLKDKLITDDIYVDVFDGLDSDTLLDSYVLTVSDLSMLEDTVARLREMDGIFQVNATTEIADILTGIKQTVYLAGSIIVLILVVVSMVIITNTIKLTVFSRRKEINIMKYVGATDSFIRFPFLVEGMLIGLIAAVLAFLFLGLGYTYLLQWAGEKYAENLTVILTNTVDFWGIAHYIFGGFAAMGVFIGVLGSGLFVRKHLRV